MGRQDHRQVLTERLRGHLTRRAFLWRVGGTVLAAGAAPSHRVLAARSPRRGGTLRVAWLEPVESLDPHFATSPGATRLQGNLYNGLLKVDYDGRRVRFLPDLAERWEMPNPLTHLFTLRRGVRFHSGEELTAEDVQWNQERLANDAAGSPHGWRLAALDRIQVLDRHTIRFTFRQPYQSLPVAWTGTVGRAGAVVSRQAAEKHGRAYGRNPSGTGPFRLVDWVENDRIVLERHRDYFEAGADRKPLPYLDRVLILLNQQPAIALGAVMTGEIDGISQCPFPFVAMLRNNPNLAVYSQVEGATAYLGMNTRRPPFDDKALRQAVTFAIDRTVLVQAAYSGEAIPACAALPPAVGNLHTSAPCAVKQGQHFDLGKARALLGKAKVQGPIEVEYMTTSSPTWPGGAGPRLAERIQLMLARIGIRVRIQLYDPATWRRRRDSGDFELYDDGWGEALDPDATLFQAWHSIGPANFVGYSNPELDRLLTEARFEGSPSKRKALYEKADLLLADDAPCAFLVHPKGFKILSKRARNFASLPADRMSFHAVWV